MTDSYEILKVEYESILKHYFNDDRAYWTAINYFVLFSGLLMTVFISTMTTATISLRLIFIMIGFFISISWFCVLVRIEAHRKTAIYRGKEIETIFKQEEPKFIGMFCACEIYGFSKNRFWAKIQKISVFKLLLILPLLMTLVWGFLFVQILINN